MAQDIDLMGVGVTAEVAKRVGFFMHSANDAETLVGPGNKIVYASADSLILGDGFAPGDVVIIAPTTACSVSPGASGQINEKATASAAAVGVNSPALFVRNATAGRWVWIAATA